MDLFDLCPATASRPEGEDAATTCQSEELDRRLGDVCWNFSHKRAVDPLESIHPYPAKFIPDLARSLIGRLPFPDNGIVLDPFCGSGTTLVEAQRAGIRATGIDLNPIACLISRVKTSPLAPGLLEAGAEVIKQARHLSNPEIPAIPNLDHWFMRSVQHSLAALTNSINEAPTDYRDALRLALSSIIVRVSNQDSDTRYAAVKKSVSSGDVFHHFARSLRKIGGALYERSPDHPSVDVIQSNILAVKPEQIDRGVSLVVTSPPYPNAYEYWLYHKYRMWWLGYDPISVKGDEIGARAHFFKKNPHSAADFYRQMSGVFSLLSKVMVQGGYACFVVGRSRIRGEVVDNAEIIKRAGSENGFCFEYSAEREILAKRKSFNLSHANIKKETVLVLRQGR